MNNQVYYIKPTNNNHSGAIKDGLVKALSIVKQKKYSNIKFVVTSIELLDSPPNFISEGLDKLFDGDGVRLTNLLKKNRRFPIPDFPAKGQTTGVNLLSSNNNLNFIHNNTVVVLVWADYDSFKKVQSLLFGTQIDLVAIVFNETPEINELLSASKGTNISSTPDSNVISYPNTFAQNVRDILNRMKGINTTEVASHTPTRERMKSVIDELTKNGITVSYADFLGFLVNDVNFKLEESVKLLKWKHNYFGR